jgi:hypothetical protein
VDLELANKQEYPCIYAIACNFLAILAAKVNVKRLFNIRRDLLSLKCTAISRETIRAIIIVKDYLRRQKFGIV